MTVMDLIDELKKYPLNMEVKVGMELSQDLVSENLTEVFEEDGHIILYSEDL